jgi:hypothetical protein
MRWSLRLAEFDFEVEHRPSAKIRHVDALSRHVQTVMTDHTLSKDAVRDEQSKDKLCSRLQVGKGKGRSEYFYDEERVIYKRRRNKEPQLVVPQSLVRDVIAQNHDSIYASHPGESESLIQYVSSFVGQQ